jgi:hypothetical protein
LRIKNPTQKVGFLRSKRFQLLVKVLLLTVFPFFLSSFLPVTPIFREMMPNWQSQEKSCPKRDFGVLKKFQLLVRRRDCLLFLPIK